MAYVDVKSNSWKNADGLIVYFGTDEGKTTRPVNTGRLGVNVNTKLTLILRLCQR